MVETNSASPATTHTMSRHEEANSEVEALLMDDLTIKESTLEAAYKPDPPTLLQRIGRVIPKLFQVATRPRSTAAQPVTVATTSKRGFLAVAFNYIDDDFKLRPTSWLDGLRGLAALEVFIFHYLDRWLDKSLAYGDGRYRELAWFRLPFIRTLYASGDCAVCVFFAISGYVLAHRMLGLIRQGRQEELHSALSSAVFRRGIRLYMPVVIETFTLMLVGRYIGGPKPTGWINEPTLILELKRWFIQLIHLFIPLRYPDRWEEVLNLYDGSISWTIPLEYYGSLVIYTILLLFSRTRSMRVRHAILAALVVSSFLKDDWIGGQFLMGMAFADYQLDRHVATRPRTIFFWCVAIFGFYLAGMPSAHYVDEKQKYRLWARPFFDWITQPLAAIGLYANRQVDRYIECFAGVCILVGVGETERLKRFTEARFVQYLGKISFGLYLCHIFVQVWVRYLDHFWLRFMHMDPTVPPHLRQASLNYFLSYCLMMATAVPLNFFVAGLFERFVDKPSIQAAKNFEKWCLQWNRSEDQSYTNGVNGSATGAPASHANGRPS